MAYRFLTDPATEPLQAPYPNAGRRVKRGDVAGVRDLDHNTPILDSVAFQSALQQK